MNAKEQENLVGAFRHLDLINKYKEMYGKDWRQIYEEDKENDCLLKVGWDVSFLVHSDFAGWNLASGHNWGQINADRNIYSAGIDLGGHEIGSLAARGGWRPLMADASKLTGGKNGRDNRNSLRW